MSGKSGLRPCIATAVSHHATEAPRSVDGPMPEGSLREIMRRVSEQAVREIAKAFEKDTSPS